MKYEDIYNLSYSVVHLIDIYHMSGTLFFEYVFVASLQVL